jgi:FixJ family two-component response regulator
MPMTRQLIIVEDDASTRRSLSRWARVSGYDVVAFDSASAFLACDIRVEDCCLILDIGLPGIDGPALKRRLIAKGQDLPTVFITALTDDEIDIALSGIAAPCVLRKPFESAALEAAIKAIGDRVHRSIPGALLPPWDQGPMTSWDRCRYAVLVALRTHEDRHARSRNDLSSEQDINR